MNELEGREVGAQAGARSCSLARARWGTGLQSLWPRRACAGGDGAGIGASVLRLEISQVSSGGGAHASHRRPDARRCAEGHDMVWCDGEDSCDAVWPS